MSKTLWCPSKENISKSNIESFRGYINHNFNLNLVEYRELHQWSINNIESFWESVWLDSNIKYSKKYNSVIDDLNKMPGAKWFKSSRLNYAENLLQYKSDKVAIEFYGEDQVNYSLSYSELHDLVAKISFSLRKIGLKSGDRVAATTRPRLHRGLAGGIAGTLV